MNSALTFGLAGLLGLLFYGLLWLAASLLQGIGLSAPNEWLGRSRIVLPLILGAAAFFVAALRAQPWGTQLTRTLGNVVGFLLPVAALIALLFAAVVPVAALQNPAKLYSGLLNSGVYLSVTLIFELLTLAAFASPSALARPLQRFTRFTAYLLPFYPLLALYGLSVRVAQYGLTENRLLALLAAVWLLASALALACTRRVPAFDGLPKVTAGSLALLAALGLAFSLPGLRPLEWSARSQAARLLRPGLSERQSAETIQMLAYGSGSYGKGLLATLPAEKLSPAAREQLAQSQRPEGWQFNDRYIIRAPQRPKLTLLPGSLPLLEAQRATLLPSLKLDYPPYTAYALPLAEGLRVMIMNGGERFSGLWFDIDAAGKIKAQGTFSTLEVPYRDRSVNWSQNPFERTPKAETLTLPVVRAGGITFILKPH